MREYFDNELNELNNELLKMACHAKEIVTIASSCIGKRDDEVIKKVKPLYEKIDKEERIIESSCMKLLLLQQPVASDLRQISSILKMITDLQRIGDQAENIAEILNITNNTVVSENKYVQAMSKYTLQMLNDSVDSFVNKNLDEAKAVIKQDDEVDKCFFDVKNNLIEIIHENKNDGEFIIDILMCAKYFEKIGDHCVNIAKWSIYYQTGEHIA